MKSTLVEIICLVTGLTVGLSPAPAAAPRPSAEPQAALTAAGDRLLERYTGMLSALREDIVTALPKVDGQKKTAFLKACEDEIAAAAVEKKTLQAASAKGAKNKDELANAHKAAQESLAQRQAGALQAARALLAEVEPLLASDKLDARLVQCAVLVDATPHDLAAFAQQGKEQEDLVEKLLADHALMKQMLIAGGAKNGKYGQAMQIYALIQKASPKARDGVPQRLALATSLEHAVPVAQDNPAHQPDAPATVDPVKRYFHYEKAYLDGELDPAFKSLSVWEYRMVVNSEAPDHVLAWGREMLRNYRPDHIRTANTAWRYAIIVKTDVLYGSQDVKNDIPTLHAYQNIIKNGGVCGRRAFFGRFILRCFGIPVWGVTQHAHAAVGRWTPKGWVVNLGAGWKWSWWDHDKTPRSGADFLLETQVRKVPDGHLKVLRAQWLGAVLGEQHYNDRKSVLGGFWNATAQYQSKLIAAEAKAVELGPVGQDVAESNESKEVVSAEKVGTTEADKKIVVSQDGLITIPAVALIGPAGNKSPVLSMKSFSGGMQLHCSRDLKADQKFEYRFEAPHAGKYALAAQVVTVQSGQKLLLTPTDAKESVEIGMPYTLGRWEQTPPVEITLTKGQNVLRFTHPAPSRGLTIKGFTLTPVK